MPKHQISQYFEDEPQQEHDVFATATPTKPIRQEPTPEEAAVNGVHPLAQCLRLQHLGVPPRTFKHLATLAHELKQDGNGAPAPAPE